MATERADLPLLRPMGVIERYMVARSQLGIYQKVAVTARYQRKNTSTLKSKLYAALAIVVSKHSVLSATAVDVDSKTPSFARLPYIDLDQVVTFNDIETLDDVDGKFSIIDRFLETEHTRQWDLRPALPLWRIHVFQRPGDTSRFILSYFFHHALGDTKSALVFQEAVEAALNDTAPDAQSTSRITTPTDLPLLPPLDDIPRASPPGGRSGASENVSGLWTGGVQSLPVDIRLRSLWLSAEQSTRLAQQCKKNGVSVTAALQTMLAAAVFQQIPEEYTTVKTSIPVSLRGWLPSPITAESIGAFIDTFPETYHRGPFSWEEARRSKATIDKVVQNQCGHGLIQKLSRVQDVQAEVDEAMGHPRSASFEMSNVGKLGPLQPEKDYQIESLLFSQSAGAMSAALKEGVVEDGFGGKVVEEVGRILERET
ncbi:Alcohol acetyltransferase [Elasticomyces elasticus]|uniref:Alcohol acetyltransferase n=1 Tax=Exophiala sideris TaxID=1016849 RepID=A0ABR0JR49_9EURO|nr:Alcohol acetyltransferase [Elasticomyces elasticus]KAK5034632.1 Alcohol acetyltransferase [Exophiala sideris]KAK5040046.1 Alcohol acetyltransferase [Exophiala sideris]KAK5068424.1 Alcohol acetyltransferase [Exophiala sideris]KAK5187726.1 Alcohol acetyltransferase [Eurotiomycetes sp. CCFEE 6388]